MIERKEGKSEQGEKEKEKAHLLNNASACDSNSLFNSLKCLTYWNSSSSFNEL